MTQAVDAISSVVDTVGDAIGTVGNAIDKTATAIVDNVVKPVAQTVESTVKAAVDDPVGTLIKVTTAIVAPEFLPLVSAGDTLAKGGDLGDALKSAATTYVAQGVGEYAGNMGDQATAAAQYGTEIGSQQTAMLAAQDAGMGTVNDLVGNSIGSTAANIVRGQDPLTALANGGINAGTAAVTAQVPGFESLSAAQQRAVNAAVASTLATGDPSQALVNAAISAGIAEARKDPAAFQSTSPASDDGTTAGIQDVINDIQTRPQDDGTTTGIQDIIDTVTGGSLGDASDLPPDQGGSLGDESDLPPDTTGEEPQCAPGYSWNGSICVADSDVTDTSTTCPDGYLFDLNTQSCVPIGTSTGGTTGGKTTTGGTTGGKTTTGGTTGGGTAPKTPTIPATPTTPSTTTGNQLDLQSLLALLGAAGGTGQGATPPPTVDIGTQFDIDSPLETNPFAKQQTHSKMATGGSIDDLLALLQQRG